MADFTSYMAYQYQAGARGDGGLIDCWGLVRLVRSEVYGFPLLPEFASARFGDAGSIQDAYAEQSGVMRQVEPREGVIVAAIRNGVCLHVAVMVDSNRVLDIRKKGARARLIKHSDWLRDFPAPIWEVRYYCDQDKPKQA